VNEQSDVNLHSIPVCLMMIVRNEEAVLPRLIESVLPLISSWVIIDTGSTDKTPDIAQHLLGHLPGSLLHREWVNFGHNRTELIQQMPHDVDFALLLDADHVLEVDSVEDFFRELKENHSDNLLMLNVIDTPLTYAMPYMVRSGTAYRFVGSTHEYITSDSPISKSAPLESIRVRHLGDGGFKSDKLERDRELLERELREAGDSPRTRFYLGQTFEMLGSSELAIEHYSASATLATWDEEKYVATLRVGRLLKARGDSQNALSKFFAANEICPDRSESIYEIVKILQEMGGYKFAHRALNNAAYRSKQRILFLEPWITDFALPIEEAVVAWHVGHVSEAREKFTEILTKPGITPDLESLIKRNLEFCK